MASTTQPEADAPDEASPAKLDTRFDWWAAIDQRIEAAIEADRESQNEMFGTALGETIAEERAATNKKLAELERTLLVIREEVGLEKKLAGLHRQIDCAVERTPDFNVENELATMRAELTKAQKQLLTARGTISQLEYSLGQLREGHSKTRFEIARTEVKVETIGGVTERMLAELGALDEMPISGHG
jgi:chromosome segregation ATPase